MITYDKIQKECQPMKHYLISPDGERYIYNGFNQSGRLVTSDGQTWPESVLTKFEIKGIEPIKYVTKVMFKPILTLGDSFMEGSTLYSTREECFAMSYRCRGIVEVKTEIEE